MIPSPSLLNLVTDQRHVDSGSNAVKGSAGADESFPFSRRHRRSSHRRLHRIRTLFGHGGSQQREGGIFGNVSFSSLVAMKRPNRTPTACARQRVEFATDYICTVIASGAIMPREDGSTPTINSAPTLWVIAQFPLPAIL